MQSMSDFNQECGWWRAEIHDRSAVVHGNTMFIHVHVISQVYTQVRGWKFSSNDYTSTWHCVSGWGVVQNHLLHIHPKPGITSFKDHVRQNGMGFNPTFTSDLLSGPQIYPSIPPKVTYTFKPQVQNIDGEIRLRKCQCFGPLKFP